MKLTVISHREAALIQPLVDLWQRSVTATHQFLSADEIADIQKYVPQALQQVPILVVAFDGARPVGFMGIAGNKLEMLFLDPDVQGLGLGKQLVQLAFDRYGVSSVVVNEQNPHAVGFYQHMGFQTVSRSPIDEQGQPYPILTMHRH
ncbi:acetyltransferase [Lacticaseibacillus porcinae]|uniref:acetyltransferase n=1 Tax=Lacticaseibacillus porcinae TaxID=1123687 RepID=UPI000F7A3901|nr:acetyltransferase [Lacticaseibacillus porcinae]